MNLKTFSILLLSANANLNTPTDLETRTQAAEFSNVLTKRGLAPKKGTQACEGGEMSDDLKTTFSLLAAKFLKFMNEMDRLSHEKSAKEFKMEVMKIDFEELRQTFSSMQIEDDESGQAEERILGGLLGGGLGGPGDGLLGGVLGGGGGGLLGGLLGPVLALVFGLLGL